MTSKSPWTKSRQAELGKHAEQQLDLDAAARIGERDGERLRTVGLGVGVGGGQARQVVLTLADLVAHVAQIAAEGAVAVAHDEHGAAQVAVALEGELLRQDVERVGARLGLVGARAASAAVRIGEQVPHIALGAGTVIQMQQVAEPVRLHLVGRVPRVQREGTGRLVDENGHRLRSISPCRNRWDSRARSVHAAGILRHLGPDSGAQVPGAISYICYAYVASYASNVA